MLLINYIKNSGEIDVSININTFLNHYINSFEPRIKWFFVAVFIIINLDLINFMPKFIVIYNSPFFKYVTWAVRINVFIGLILFIKIVRRTI